MNTRVLELASFSTHAISIRGGRAQGLLLLFSCERLSRSGRRSRLPFPLSFTLAARAAALAILAFSFTAFSFAPFYLSRLDDAAGVVTERVD